MRVRNMMPYPIRLGDNEWVGAAGSGEDERDYQSDSLAEYDRDRVKHGYLQIVVPSSDDVPSETKQETNESEAAKPQKNGGKR